MNRYARQTVLPEMGQEGQERLKSASVLCIGAGGLGSPALLYLAAAGIGRIGLVDDDAVDISNLQRQVLFKEADQGKPKVEAAKAALAELNSECQIEAYFERFSAENAEALLKNYDVIIDGTDNFSSKFLINDACVKFGKPLVYGSILGFVAQVSVFWAGHGPCYRCLYPKPPSGHIPTAPRRVSLALWQASPEPCRRLKPLKWRWAWSGAKKRIWSRCWVRSGYSMHAACRLKRLNCINAINVRMLGDPSDIVLEQAEESCAAKTDVKNISAEDAAKRMGKAVFIDVREAHELASGRIPKALHIPLGTLLSNEDSVGDIASDTPVIVYCQHGIRSFSGGFSSCRAGLQKRCPHHRRHCALEG
jgi:molybdopterin/thiamine biosynthesis adenylyltransferase